MTIMIRRSPTRTLALHRPLTLFEETEELARRMWDSWSFVYPTTLAPRLDMYQEKDELVIKGEFPGIKKEDLDISLEGDELTIKAEKKQEEVTEDATYYTCERSYGQYSRSVSLPFPVNTEKVSANFKDGLLEIRLPKAEESKSRHIEVKVE